MLYLAHWFVPSVRIGDIGFLGGVGWKLRW
jgi:hypothetical protein